MQYVLGLFILYAAFKTFKDPFAGLLALLMITVIQPGELYPLFGTLRVERLMVLLVGFSAFLNQDVKFRLTPISKRLVWFWIAVVAGIPFAFWPGGTFWSALEFGKTIVYHVLIAILLTTEERFRAFLFTFSGLITYLAATSAYTYFHGGSVFAQGIDRAQGLTSSGGDPNSLGLTLASGLPIICLFVLKGTKRSSRLIGIAMVAIVVYTIILTGSRSAFFCLIGLVVLFGATRKKAPILVPAAALLALITWQIIPAEYQQRYTSVKNLDEDASYQNRLIAWRSGMLMFRDNPLTGVGMANFPNANGSKYWVGKGTKIWLQPHSLYVQLPAELGLLGVITFLLYLISIVRTNRWLKRQLATLEGFSPPTRYFPVACSFSIVALLIGGYAAHDLYRTTWYMLGALTAALYSIAQGRISSERVSDANELATGVAV